jgi:lysophospholipase L1-like esterase
MPLSLLRECLLAGLVLLAGSAAPAGSASEGVRANPAAVQFVPASDPRFHYEGRIDFSRPAEPVVIWAGSRISLDFDGPLLALRFAGATGQNFFNAIVDGDITVVALPAGGGERVGISAIRRMGRHHLLLFKRSEAAAGQVHFAGVEIAGDGHAWAPPAPAYELKMEFFGDSIMVGACNEDGAKDQWEDRRTHNNALSYTTLTAAAFSADYRCLAISGMGIATGWTDIKAGQAWDRLYPVVGAPPANLQAWQPDVAFLNFGENDDSYSRAHNQPFPAGYTAGYVALVKAMRAAYPHAQLVLLRGGMFGGAQSAPLRDAWKAAVTELEAGDKAVSHFVFSHWSSTHPRVTDDRALADELTAWLKTQPFMRRFL